MQTVAHITPAQAPAAPIFGSMYANQQPKVEAAYHEAAYHEAAYHEESSSSASSTEREEGSASSSSSSSGTLSTLPVSTRFPENWQTPVVKFRVRRTVTKKSTHPIAEARMKAEREQKAKAKANGGGKRQTGGRNVNMPVKTKQPALPTVPQVADLSAGMEVTGVVTSVHEFGVFMNVGWKRDALLHKNEVYHKGACDPFAEFQVGKKFAVWVIDVFEGDNARPARAGLSLVSPTGKIYIRNMSEGDLFYGEVTRVLPFGLIVEFGAEVDGMVHQSELYDLPENFNVGDTLDVEVKFVDRQARRVSLRLPEETGYVSMDDLKVGQEYRGKVVHHRTSGVVVAFSAGFEGFVHVSELRGEPTDFAYGDMIHVEIKRIDRHRKRISLRRHYSLSEFSHSKRPLNNTARARVTRRASTSTQSKSAVTSTGDKSKSQKPLSKSAKRRQRKQKRREAAEASN